MYAFDPSLYASNRLTETISYNDLLNVHFQSAALGDAAGERPIFVSRDPGDNRRSMLPFADSIPIRTPVNRLDDALEEQGIKVDLLRVDVSGYEPNVLKGASRYLKERRIAAILCAFDGLWLGKNGSSQEAFYELLSPYDYYSPVAKVTLNTVAKSALLVLKP